jgi:hypothetical protein
LQHFGSGLQHFGSGAQHFGSQPQPPPSKPAWALDSEANIIKPAATTAVTIARLVIVRVLLIRKWVLKQPHHQTAGPPACALLNGDFPAVA